MRRLCLIAGSVLIAGLMARPAAATTLTFDTSQSQFIPGVDNQGFWYAPNWTENDNYLVGGNYYRSFFTFDLSTLDLTGQEVVSATLELARYRYSSEEPFEVIEFFDVTTPAANLYNGRSDPAVYADLASGVSYGSFVVPAYLSGPFELLTFDFNAAALLDVTNAAGGFFSVGATLTSAPGFLFLGSSGAGIQRLVLNVEPATAVPAPEPASMLLLGSGLVAVTARRWRRAR